MSVVIVRSDKCVRHKVLCLGQWHGHAVRPAPRAIRNDKNTCRPTWQKFIHSNLVTTAKVRGARERHNMRTRVQVTDRAPQLDALYCTVSLTFLAHESVLQ